MKLRGTVHRITHISNTVAEFEGFLKRTIKLDNPLGIQNSLNVIKLTVTD